VGLGGWLEDLALDVRLDSMKNLGSSVGFGASRVNGDSIRAEILKCM
jgi:hypothetical protein